MPNLRLLIAPAAIGLLASCGSTEPTIQLGQLTVTIAPVVSSLMVNDTARVSARGTGTTGKPYPVGPIDWVSTDPNVFTVDTGGLIEARHLGAALLIGQFDARSDTIALTVAGLLHLESAITTDVSWSQADSPHGVRGAIAVGGPAHPLLTVEAGSEVRFSPGGELTFGFIGPGSLNAAGTPAAPITLRSLDTVATAGSWVGLTFRGADTSSLSHVRLQSCGASRGGFLPGGCLLASTTSFGIDPTLRIVSVEVDSALGTGLYLQGRSRLTAGSSGLTVRQTAGPVAVLPAGEVEHFPLGGTLQGNTNDTIVLTGDTIRTSVTWQDLGAPLLVIDPVVVEGPAAPVLTIPPGFQLAFGPNLSTGANGTLQVGMSAPGGLQLGASGAAWVTLRSLSPFFPGGIAFGSQTVSSAIRRATFDGTAGIHIMGNSVTRGPQVPLEDVTLVNGYGTGIEIRGGGEIAPGSTGLVIQATQGSPFTVYNSRVSSIPTGQYTGNQQDQVFVYSTWVDTTETWKALDVPYYLQSGVGVAGPASPELIVEPGVHLIFGPGGELQVGAIGPGRLTAVGTPAAPIRLEAQYPGGGTWTGIDIDSLADPASRLDYVTVDGAGGLRGNVAGGILLNVDLGSNLAHTTISNSAGCGIVLVGAGPFPTDYTAPALGNAFVQNVGAPQCGP